MNWLKRKWIQFYTTFVSLKGSPEKMAQAFAVGFWIAWMPVGTHTVLAIVLAAALRANMPAMFLGTWICNPFTCVPIVVIDYKLGSLYVGGIDIAQFDLASTSFQQLLGAGWEVAALVMLGGLLLGTLNALVGYYPVKWAVIRTRRRARNAAAAAEAET